MKVHKVELEQLPLVENKFRKQIFKHYEGMLSSSSSAWTSGRVTRLTQFVL